MSCEGVCLSLAGRCFEVEGSLERVTRLPGLEPFLLRQPCRTSPDWGLRLGVQVHPLWGRVPLYAFETEQPPYRCELSAVEEHLYFTMEDPAGRSFVMCVPPSGKGLTATRPLDAEQLRFALWMAVAVQGVQAGVLPLHASAVADEEGAVLFLGESGTGKSTRSRLWLQEVAGSHLLNDDSPLVAVRENGVEVYGSPWSGKVPCFRNEHCPLRAVVRLRRSESDCVRRLQGIETMAALLPSCPPALACVPRLAGGVMEAMGRLAAQVPVYEMAFRVEPRPSATPIRMLRDVLAGQGTMG